RLSRLIEFLDPTDPEGMHARLARWCESAHGEYAWVFDNPSDSVVARLSAHPTIGFDVTEFLDHELLRAPITLYVFHLVRGLLDGRRLVCWMDEFWRLLDRKSTRLNSSHRTISYAVFCLKKKKKV